jgi:hypothetical protein
MGVAWYFPLGEIWAKCQECGTWNKIDEKLETFKRSPEEPYKFRCSNGHIISIQRVYFSRKGMKKPT